MWRYNAIMIITFVSTVQSAFFCNKDLEPMEDFRKDLFLGGWHLYESTCIADLGSTCTSIIATYDYSDRLSGNMMLTTIDGNSETTNLWEYNPSTQKYSVHYQSLFGPSTYPAAIIDTDYFNYAVVYTCRYLGIERILILTKDRQPEKKVVDAAHKTANRAKSILPYLRIDQNNCDD